MAKKTADYFHVTATANVPAILADGLKGSTTPRHRGETLAKATVFVIVSREDALADYIAMSQVFPCADIGSYALLRISAEGITGEVQPDNVAERGAPWQRAIEQELIDTKYVTVERIKQLDFPGKAVNDILHGAMLRRVLTAEEWAVARKWIAPEMCGHQRNWEAKKKRGKGSGSPVTNKRHTKLCSAAAERAGHLYAANQMGVEPSPIAPKVWLTNWAKHSKDKKELPSAKELAEVFATVDEYVSGKSNSQTVYMQAPIFARIKKERFAASLSKPRKPRRKAIYVDIATACA